MALLVDGSVRATWRIGSVRGSATLPIEPFEPLAKEERDALSEEGERLLRSVEDEAEAFLVRFAEELWRLVRNVGLRGPSGSDAERSRTKPVAALPKTARRPGWAGP